MSTLPILNELSDATNTVAQQKTNFEDVNRAIKQMPGGPSGVAIPTLTIAAGLVTPGDGIAGMFLIDTEAAAATDDLTNIIQTNLPAPSMIIISIANNARDVVIRNAFGGAGQIILASGANHTLTDIRHSLVLRRNGALWDQVTPGMLASPTIHGGLVSADPTVALGIASKQYVDVAVDVNRPTSLLYNPLFQINQLVGNATAVVDDAPIFDTWYALSQTAAISFTAQTLQEHGQATNVRLTQTQAAAQRFGLASIIEARDSQWLRGRTVTFRPRVRISASQAIRIAVLEWTGLADDVISDVVNNWASAAYTAGNFFLASSITVAGVAALTPGAATWTDMPALTVTLSASLNNLIVMIWVEQTAVQNVTFDVGQARLVLEAYTGEILVPTFAQVLAVCMRQFHKSFNYTIVPTQIAGNNGALQITSPFTATSTMGVSVRHLPPMRENFPSITTYNPGAANALFRNTTDAIDDGAPSVVNQSDSGFYLTFVPNAGNTVGDLHAIHWTADARL